MDGIIVTHSHADAILGLDDLRNFTAPPRKDGKMSQPHVTVHLSQDSMGYVNRAFPYLVSKSAVTGGGDVSSIKYCIFDEDDSSPSSSHSASFQLKKFSKPKDSTNNAILEEKPMNAVKVTPLPVHHGTFNDESPFIAHGFLLDRGIAYISDANEIPPKTMALLLNPNGNQPLDLLILDCLRGSGSSHKSHMCLDQALETIRELRPKLALLTGISHNMDHHATNEGPLALFKKETGISVKLALDGLCIKLKLAK